MCDSIGPVGFDELTRREDPSAIAHEQGTVSDFLRSIFSGEKCDRLIKPNTNFPGQIAASKKVESVSKIIAPMKVGGSGRVDVTVTFGGNDGAEVTVSGKAEVHDDRGNSAEVKVENNGEETTITVSGKHDEE